MICRLGYKGCESILFNLRFMWTLKRSRGRMEGREGGRRKGTREARYLRAGDARPALASTAGRETGCAWLLWADPVLLPRSERFALKMLSSGVFFNAFEVTFFHSPSASASLTKHGHDLVKQNLRWPPGVYIALLSLAPGLVLFMWHSLTAPHKSVVPWSPNTGRFTADGKQLLFYAWLILMNILGETAENLNKYCEVRTASLLLN